MNLKKIHGASVIMDTACSQKPVSYFSCQSGVY